MRESNLLERIYEEHHNITQEKLMFSICFAVNGGAFSLGNVNQAIHSSAEPVVVKLRENGKSSLRDNLNSMFGLAQTKFYSLDLEQLYVGNRSLNFAKAEFAGDGMFIDSGATYSYMPSNHYNIVLEELDKMCN